MDTPSVPLLGLADHPSTRRRMARRTRTENEPAGLSDHAHNLDHDSDRGVQSGGSPVRDPEVVVAAMNTHQQRCGPKKNAMPTLTASKSTNSSVANKTFGSRHRPHMIHRHRNRCLATMDPPPGRSPDNMDRRR